VVVFNPKAETNPMSLGIPRNSTPPNRHRSSSPQARMMTEDDGGDDPCCDSCGGACSPFIPYYASFGSFQEASKFSIASSGGGGSGGGGSGSFSSDPVRYSNGEVKMMNTDLSSRGFGVPWGHTRSYSNQLTNQTGGANGNSWRVAEWPYLVEASPTSVCVVAGTIYDAVWFDLVQGNYVPRFGVSSTLVHDIANQQYIYTDARGYRAKLFDYSLNISASLQGQFKSFTDLSGRETLPSYDPKTNQITSFVRQAQNISSGFYYVYYTEGDNVGQLQHVTLVVNGAEVRRTYYTYYGTDEKFGNLNDLKLATIQQNSDSGWADLDVAYYRYYKSGNAYGFAHGLRYMIGPQTFAQMKQIGLDPLTATNPQIAAFADNAFQYDPTTQAATVEKTTGGKQKFKFLRISSNFPQDFNNWAVKTIETLPDGSQNIVYTNYAGQVILSVRQAGQAQWFVCNQYDDNGRVTMVAHSSAVQGFDESQPTLVILNPNAGLIESYVYYPNTNIAAGAVAGYMQYKQVQQGAMGQPVLLSEYQYSSRTSGQTTIYVPAKEICYPDADDALIQLLCHIYTYTWQGSTLQVDQRTTTFPLVTTNQNGSGDADSKIDAFDTYGNLTWAMDERGFLTNQTYDLATGAVVQRIQDVDTSIVSGAPAGWQTPPGGGLNLVTDYTVDGLGRITQALEPLHDVDINGVNTSLRRAKWIIYQDAIYQQWRGSGYAVPTAAGYDSTLVNPVALIFMDRSLRPTDRIQAVRADTNGPLLNTDIFLQSSWVSWSRTVYAAHKDPARVMVYFNIPDEGHGQRVIDFNQSRYFYDSMQRLVSEQAPGGTITRMVYNPMGWILGKWVGTNDNGATDSDPTGGGKPGSLGNNMVQVEANEYDNGLPGGDGNLTIQTKFADAQTMRVTTFGYDFRNRQTVVDGEIDFYQVTTYDNFDRRIQVDQYDTTADGNLVARSAINYDNRGRIYQTLRYGVDPATGTVGPALTDNNWFDPSNNVIQVNKAGSSLLQKTIYDGINRATVQYQSYNLNQTGYPYPIDVSQDTVIQQLEKTYDDASSVILQTIRERFHNATGLGALTSPTGSQPQARVNYISNWPDPLGRPHNTANYGTNQGVAISRPDTAPDSSSTVLVTTTDYNNAGQAYQVTDPMGAVMLSSFDAAGRQTQLIENYISGGSGSGQNRESDYSYNADSQVVVFTVKNSVTGDQVTQYIYGTTLEDSDIASNALVRSVIYPDDSPTTPDRITMTYNRQNELTGEQDQMGTVHAIAYDLLGRQISDSITTLGAGVDGAVLQIARTYEVRGLVENTTCFDSAVGGNVVNDVLSQFNQFSQLIGEYQSHAGPASTSSAAILYGYADGIANTVRLTSLQYPNGRINSYDYGTPGQMNDLLSRVGAIIDDDGISRLAAYTYIGLKRIAQVNSPQPGTMLTYIQQGANNPPVGSGGDQYTGWDQFSRVVDQRWLNTAGTDLERCQFGYNQANNRLWRKNVVAVTGQDEFYTYDGLSQLLTFQRGTLNSGDTGLIGTPLWEEDFTFDPTGNWQNYVNQVNGQTTLNQPRTHNPINEISTINGSGSLINQDANGNINKVPQPANWNSAYSLSYNAWNLPVQVKGGSVIVASYAYDGLGRRIINISAGVARNYYYTVLWQIIEERTDSNNTPDRQYVWGRFGVDNLVLRDRPSLGERCYVFSDYASVTAIADADGVVVERYGYNAFGTPLFMAPDFTPLTSSQYEWETLYDSYRWDAETGFYQVRNRYLHPTLGRWLTRDPIEYAGGINLYAYVNNNPNNLIDPSGLVFAGGITGSIQVCVDFCNGNFSITGWIWGGIGVKIGRYFYGPSAYRSGSLGLGHVSLLSWFHCGNCDCNCNDDSGWTFPGVPGFAEFGSFGIAVVVTNTTCRTEVEIYGTINILAWILDVCPIPVFVALIGVESAIEAMGGSMELGVAMNCTLNLCAAVGGGVSADSAKCCIGGYIEAGWPPKDVHK